MTLQNLYFFCEIVKDMNLGVTAGRLYTSQQALSGHIKRLETHFSVKLFDRRPNLVLTDEGRLLIREARTILDAENRLFIEYGTGPQTDHGTLTVACGLGRSKYYLPCVLSRFSTQYPAVMVSCVDENIYKDSPMFSRGEVDLAIGRKMRDDLSIKSKTLFHIGGSMIVARSLLQEILGDRTDGFIAQGKQHGVELRTLPAALPLIHSGMPGQEHWLCALAPELRSLPRVSVSHGNSDMLFGLCREGRGIVLVSELYSKYFQQNLAPSMQEDLLFFSTVLDGRQSKTGETLSYNAAVAHPQYFYDFIHTLEAHLREIGLLEEHPEK